MIELGMGDLVEGHEVAIKSVRQYVREASCTCGWWFQGDSRRLNVEQQIHLQQAILDGARVIRRHERAEAQ